MICSECGLEITDKHDVKHHLPSKKRFHKACFKKYYNRVEGRSKECPECKGSGIHGEDKDGETCYHPHFGATCERCQGLGYVGN